MQIILASESPSRKRLLSQAGLQFKVFPPNIQEERFLNPKKPEDSCLYIAKQKALKAQSHYPEAIIIACDQMVYFEEHLFGKAYTIKKAIDTLVQLQGQTHCLFSALCMLWKEKNFYHICPSYLSMRPLNPKQIKNYVLRERPLNSAGSYHIESQGISLFQKIKTEDFNAIEGLPLIQIFNQLIKWGYPVCS